MPPSRRVQVHPLVERAAAYGWRLLVIAGVLVGLLWLVGKLWVVFLPLVLAALLSRVLMAPTTWLRAHGWKPAIAAATVVVAFVIIIGGVVGLTGFAVGRQAGQLGPTVTHAVDDIEDWVVNDAPGDISRQDIRDARADARRSFDDWVRTSGGRFVSGAVVVFELVIGVLLGLIITFFALKDGNRFTAWLLSLLPEDRRDHARRLSAKAWSTLGGYLRGAALLGLVEGVIMGIAMTAVGAKLAVPVAALTFLLAFIPFAGAIVAGALAVLVTLATSGTGGALIILLVAVLVQQFDNELLAPWIYGKALDMHPVAVLLAITAGGALFGIAGAFLAVPVTALVVNVVVEHRVARREAAGRVAGPAPPEPG